MEKPIAAGWSELDREAAALESLELAADLHDAGRSPALVLTVGHAGWRYFFNRARRNSKGRHADLELVDVLREALGPGFDPTWTRQRANELSDDLRRHEDRTGKSPLLRIHSWTPVFALLCAIADCRKVRGSTTEKLAAWGERQTTLALEACISAPDVIARLLAVRAARGGKGGES